MGLDIALATLKRTGSCGGLRYAKWRRRDRSAGCRDGAFFVEERGKNGNERHPFASRSCCHGQENEFSAVAMAHSQGLEGALKTLQ
jgi:hypothetical protein